MNSTVLLVGSTVLVLILMALWARGRAVRIREEAAARERRAIAAVRAGDDPVVEEAPAKPREPTGETIFEPGTPTSMVPGRRGSIEVSEVLDIEELLRGESDGVASRARAQLEEPTNISLGDTLPPRPVASAAAVVAAPAQSAPIRAVADAPARAAGLVRAKPVSGGAATSPAVAYAGAGAQRPPLRTPLPIEAASAAPRGMSGNGAMAAAKPAMQRAPAPMAVEASMSASVAAVTPARGHAAPPATSPTAPGGEIPLRELVLAWFEARGYRSAPASPVVRPIELVLRHKDDPSRAYAFVVGTQRVTAERVLQLAQQARGIGLIRVLIVADAGLTGDAPNAKRGVRVMDRAALSAELAKLDISVAAKIIAVARKRAGARVRAG